MAGATSQLPFSTSTGSSTIFPDFIPSSNAFFLAVFERSAPVVTVNVAGAESDDLLELWKSISDPGWWRSILEKPEGGRAFIEAPLAIYKAASDAIGSTTQSLYLRPWSGQTSDPAHVARLATGFLELSRSPTALFPAWLPVIFVADVFFADHVGTDWGENGPVEFLSGRRYFVSTTGSLGAGELGPVRVPARAEKPGASYNLPVVGSIRGLTQLGSGLNNTGAQTSTPSSSTNLLTLGPQPDIVSPTQIGQYIYLSAPPAVAGQVRRIVSYTAPTDSSNGGVAVLDALGVYQVGSVVGNFRIGEDVFQSSTGAHGTLLSFANGQMGIETLSGVFATGAISGTYSGATGSIAQVTRASAIPTATGVAWQVLDWDLDIGLSCRNPELFTGGRLPVLEELGFERGVERTVVEPEESYRKRIISADDVVSPNALLRAANRILTPYDGRGCLREAGSAKLPGLFYDVPPDGNPAHAFAYDMDPTVRVGDRWKVLLNFRDFRGFFLMGVPAFGLGDFSLYADMDPGFDADLLYADGYAVTDAAIHSAIYASLQRAKMGGVGFDLYVEADGCV